MTDRHGMEAAEVSQGHQRSQLVPLSLKEDSVFIASLPSSIP